MISRVAKQPPPLQDIPPHRTPTHLLTPVSISSLISATVASKLQLTGMVSLFNFDSSVLPKVISGDLSEQFKIEILTK